MKRTILGFLAGLMVWVLVASLLNRGLRMWLEGYAVAEPQMAFTLSMMWARLALAAAASLAAGAVAAYIAPFSPRLPWALGGLFLLMFIPVHIGLWAHFPIWYHLTFLLTLMPLVRLGAALVRRSA
jgi:hypothetical protein